MRDWLITIPSIGPINVFLALKNFYEYIAICPAWPSGTCTIIYVDMQKFIYGHNIIMSLNPIQKGIVSQLGLGQNLIFMNNFLNNRQLLRK